MAGAAIPCSVAVIEPSGLEKESESVREANQAIVTAIVRMAQSLHMIAIAEGVETPEQLDYLREQRCDEVQGNLISTPLDSERCMKFLLDRKAQLERRNAPATTPASVTELPVGKRGDRT